MSIRRVDAAYRAVRDGRATNVPLCVIENILAHSCVEEFLSDQEMLIIERIETGVQDRETVRA